ncbi:MAG: signal peptidase I [Actinomycetota bacterium]|nr:signal peptidase I [Actinomycetota bacterium]
MGLVLVALALVVLVGVGVAPAFGRYRVMTVLSASMRPSMAEGSLVFTTPTPAREVRVGDVITYQAPSDGRVVTHRVVEVIEPGERPVIRTKGDAMTQPDPWLARLDGGTAWRMRAAVPFAGYAVNALRKGAVGQATTVVLPMFALASALAAIWRRQDDVGHTITVDRRSCRTPVAPPRDHRRRCWWR